MKFLFTVEFEETVYPDEEPTPAREWEEYLIGQLRVALAGAGKVVQIKSEISN